MLPTLFSIVVSNAGYEWAYTVAAMLAALSGLSLLLA